MKEQVKKSRKRPVRQTSNLQTSHPQLSVDQTVALDDLVMSEGYQALKSLLDQALKGEANKVIAMEGNAEELFRAKTEFRGAQKYVMGVIGYLDGYREQVKKEQSTKEVQ